MPIPTYPAAIEQGRDASIERPIYEKVEQQDNKVTRLFMITVDEGWRQSILCTDMYEWAADWLLGVLSHRPQFTSYGQS